jgi:hypothetical protein
MRIDHVKHYFNEPELLKQQEIDRLYIKPKQYILDKIDEIYEILLNKKYSIALKNISDIIVQNQYFLLDIINEIHLKLRKDLINNDMSKDKFSKIIIKLKNVEQNSFITVSEPLLISEFVGAFY